MNSSPFKSHLVSRIRRSRDGMRSVEEKVSLEDLQTAHKALVDDPVMIDDAGDDSGDDDDDPLDSTDCVGGLDTAEDCFDEEAASDPVPTTEDGLPNDETEIKVIVGSIETDTPYTLSTGSIASTTSAHEEDDFELPPDYESDMDAEEKLLFAVVQNVVGASLENAQERVRRHPLAILRTAVMNRYRTAVARLRKKRREDPDVLKYLDTFDTSMRTFDDVDLQIQMLCSCTVQRLRWKVESTMQAYNRRIERLGSKLPKFLGTRMSWKNYATFWELDHVGSLGALYKRKYPNIQQAFRFTNLAAIPAWVNRIKSDQPLVDDVVDQVVIQRV
jgi:hypothetical protein